MVIFKNLMPVGLVRLLEYQNRFRALNLPPHFAFYRKYREAIEGSRIELMPAESLSSLKCVVDVGANLGKWSIGIALLTKAQQIIAYEPIPRVFRHLQENTKNYSQIRCVQSAVGSMSDQVKMTTYQMHQLSSVLPIRDEARAIHGIQRDKGKDILVPMTTLDEDLQAYDEISLLKVDVQGYEPEVFAGARSVLRRTRILMAEVTYSPYYRGDLQFENLNRLITSLSALKLWGISAPACSPSGKPLWADAVFMQDKE